MSVKTYDPACYELAEHFLKDEPASEHSTPYEQACHDLALTIQQAVEDWFVQPAPINDVAQRAVMRYPYFTEKEAEEIATAVVAMARRGRHDPL